MDAVIVAELRKDNPHAKFTDINVFATALCRWAKAQANICKNGEVCANPRTGAPLVNPFLRVQDSALSVMLKYPKIKSDRVWTLLTQLAQAEEGADGVDE
jgi:phage terminase small subunit